MALPIDLFSQADSTRVVAGAYNTSLVLGAIPMLGVATLALLERRLSRGTSALVWRAVVIAMAFVAFGALLPMSWRAWVLPELLAVPLQSLGATEWRSGATPGEYTWPRVLVGVWLVGAALLLGRWIAAHRAMLRLLDASAPNTDPSWANAGSRAARAVPTRRAVEVRVTALARVPMAVGWLNPVILLPAGLDHLADEERLAILVHERAHIAHGDSWVALLLRGLEVAYWFHPAVWFAARRTAVSCEGAADEWVLASGVRASTYASLLGLHAWPHPSHSALGFAGRGALRQRLAWITSRPRTLVPRLATHRLVLAAAALLAAPLGTVQLTPTRRALDGMMRRDRWETRAFAVARLAQRADSVAVAQVAAVSDPSPLVRAAARAALARAGQRPLPPTA